MHEHFQNTCMGNLGKAGQYAFGILDASNAYTFTSNESCVYTYNHKINTYICTYLETCSSDGPDNHFNLYIWAINKLPLAEVVE